MNTTTLTSSLRVSVSCQTAKLFFMATVMSSALAVLLALRISAIRRYLYEVFYGRFHYGHSFHTPE